MALLELALAEKVPHLHLVHIDHAWRDSSADEAEQLQKLAESLNLPFHLKRLAPQGTTNLEEIARNARLDYFEQIYAKLNAGALLLGHHMDDQAETVLKRLFEGASLPKLAAMQTLSHHRNMRIIRPLLHLPKSALKTTRPTIDDPTNRDPKYLRSRMRTTLIPSLEAQFGKSISRNLSRLSQNATQLTAYLDRRISHHKVQHGPYGALIDADLSQIDPYEWRHLISTLAPLTASQLNTATSLQKSTGHIPLKTHDLHIDRGRIILTAREPFTTAQGPPQKHTWQHLILHRPPLSHPQKPTLPSKLPVLTEYYRKSRIPAFLRPLLPIVLESDKITHTFV